MHRRCQKIIGAAIPKVFPSMPLCLVLLHKSDYSKSQRSSFYGHQCCLHQNHYLRHDTKQVVAKNSHWVLSKIKALSKGIGHQIAHWPDSTALNTLESEIYLLDNFQLCCRSFVIIKATYSGLQR